MLGMFADSLASDLLSGASFGAASSLVFISSSSLTPWTKVDWVPKLDCSCVKQILELKIYYDIYLPDSVLWSTWFPQKLSFLQL